MPSEESTIRHKSADIVYRIIRSDRRKRSIAISVDPALGTIVTAPSNVSIATLDAFVQNKAEWIADKLSQCTQCCPQTKREFVSGETFYYLGSQYRLRVLLSDTPCAVYLDHRWIVVTVSVRILEEDRPKAVRKTLENWMKSCAFQHFQDRVAIYAPKFGVPVPKVQIKPMSKSWGKCSSTGELSFNWKLIQASTYLIDQVVAHELCHLRHFNHGKSFWNLLGQIVPDYEKRKQELWLFGPNVAW